MAKKKQRRCQCGRVVTDAPLAECVSCVICDVMMHTKTDAEQHAHCGEPPTQEVNVKRQKAKPIENVHTPVVVFTGLPDWRTFFSCQRNQIIRGQLLAYLMAGTPLQAAALPSAALLDAVLLATATRCLDAEIIDDYDELLRMTEECWRRSDWTTRVFDSYHCMWADGILKGKRDFESYEEAYIPRLAAWYLQHEVPQYFVRELESDADVRRAWKKRAA